MKNVQLIKIKTSSLNLIPGASGDPGSGSEAGVASRHQRLLRLQPRSHHISSGHRDQSFLKIESPNSVLFSANTSHFSRVGEAETRSGGGRRAGVCRVHLSPLRCRSRASLLLLLSPPPLRSEGRVAEMPVTSHSPTRQHMSLCVEFKLNPKVEWRSYDFVTCRA